MPEVADHDRQWVDQDWTKCVHEAAHAIYAQRVGWPVRSVDVDQALTVVGEPAAPLWPDHMQLAAYCLVGEYAAYRAVGRSYVFPAMEDLDCGLDWDCEQGDAGVPPLPTSEARPHLTT